MNVLVIDKQNDLVISSTTVVKIVKQLIALEGQYCNEVTVHFVKMPKIKQLHSKFFDDPSPTDCITLPLDQFDAVGYKVLGEIFVCPKAAIDYTKINGGDPYAETTLYIVHGILHLLGYDDIKNSDRLIIRKREAWHLLQLKKKKLILAPHAGKKSTKNSKPAMLVN